MSDPKTPDSTSSHTSGNNIIEARLERPFNGFSSTESNPYITQLIDLLQKKNRNLTISLVVILLIAIATGFVGFKYFYDNQNLAKNLVKAKSQQSETSTQLSDTIDKLSAAQVDKLNTQRLIKENLAAHTALTNEETAKEIEETKDTATLLALTSKILTSAESKIDSLEQDKSDMADALAKSNNDNRLLRSSYKALQSSISEKSAELATTIEMIDSVNSEKDQVLKQLRQQLEMFKSENVSLQKDISKRRSAFDALAKRYQETKAAREISLNEADRLKRNLASKQSELVSSQARLNATQKDLGSLQQRYSELETSLKAITQPMRGSSASRPSETSPNISTP